MAKVLRYTESLDRQAKQHREKGLNLSKSMLIALGIVIIGAIISFSLNNFYISFVFFIVSIIIFSIVNKKNKDLNKHLRNFNRMKSGHDGEVKVIETLKKLPDSYYIINDFRITVNRRTSQIDHVVVGPTGIFAIETKNWQGTLYGKAENIHWKVVMPDGNSRNAYNPIKQNETHTRRMEELLKKFLGKNFYLESIVVLTHPNVKIMFESDIVPVLKPDKLCNYIESYNQLHLSETEVEQIKDLIMKKMKLDSNSASTTAKEIAVTTNGVSDVCARCGKKVTDRVREFCKKNPKRFGGKVYCYECQKRIK